jgi:N6-L-threonylcarbamoyladenine synthase
MQQAHALTPLLTEENPPSFPFLVVLVSGGHTQLVLAKSFHEYRIIADCLDSKIGHVGYVIRFTASLTCSDAYDKVARLLQLPTSTQASGAVLEQFASLPPLPPYDTVPLPALPKPLSSGQHATSLQFSFSGLVSHVERVIARLQTSADVTRIGQSGQILKGASRVEGEKAIHLDGATQRELSKRFQDAAIGHLTSKIRLALESADLKEVTGVVVSGGVASNKALRQRCVARLYCEALKHQTNVQVTECTG